MSDKIWKQRVNNRNNMFVGKNNVYFVDDNLAKKCDSVFEVPDEDEVDILINA